MKKIFSLVAITDETVNIIDSYETLSYENALDMRSTIISNESGDSDDEETLETIDDNFIVEFWNYIDEWNDGDTDCASTLVWSNGVIDYLIIESNLK